MRYIHNFSLCDIFIIFLCATVKKLFKLNYNGPSYKLKLLTLLLAGVNEKKKQSYVFYNFKMIPCKTVDKIQTKGPILKIHVQDFNKDTHR